MVIKNNRIDKTIYLFFILPPACFDMLQNFEGTDCQEISRKIMILRISIILISI